MTDYFATLSDLTLSAFTENRVWLALGFAAFVSLGRGYADDGKTDDDDMVRLMDKVWNGHTRRKLLELDGSTKPDASMNAHHLHNDDNGPAFDIGEGSFNPPFNIDGTPMLGDFDMNGNSFGMSD